MPAVFEMLNYFLLFSAFFNVIYISSRYWRMSFMNIVRLDEVGSPGGGSLVR